AAVALRFDDAERPGRRDAEVRAGHRDLRREELVPQMLPRGLGELPRLIREARVDPRDALEEDIADLRAVLVDRRDEDMAGQVVAQLDDELRQVRLERVDAVRLQILVESDLL